VRRGGGIASWLYALPSQKSVISLARSRRSATQRKPISTTTRFFRSSTIRLNHCCSCDTECQQPLNVNCAPYTVGEGLNLSERIFIRSDARCSRHRIEQVCRRSMQQTFEEASSQ
jgi:hypothetical protein